jgi:hypothetical protein
MKPPVASWSGYGIDSRSSVDIGEGIECYGRFNENQDECDGGTRSTHGGGGKVGIRLFARRALVRWRSRIEREVRETFCCFQCRALPCVRFRFSSRLSLSFLRFARFHSSTLACLRSCSSTTNSNHFTSYRVLQQPRRVPILFPLLLPLKSSSLALPGRSTTPTPSWNSSSLA